ncbi:MAG: stage II sporulation protein D [Acetivibrionales bacterium]|jgi:stage II sporulation protein D
MKKLIYYAGVMVVVIVLLPLIIVKGCGTAPEPEPPEKTTEAESYKITVYVASTGETVDMDLEEYIKGVVAAEMPAGFDLEALKAQAVAARTFAYGRMSGVYASKQGMHDDADICTDSTHCQAWVSKKDAMKKWGILSAPRYWGKIERAVNETRGMIVTYQGTVANTLFHASSPGRTENAENVWQGTYVPYLRSVESEGEEASKDYIVSVMLKTDEIAEKLKEAYPDRKIDAISSDSIEILGLTVGRRVKMIKVGNIVIKGTEFRKLFGLRSACFTVEQIEDDLVRVTTTGHGHGVGMSQWGADSLAKKGGTFEEILRHYYTGVDIISIEDFEKQN